MVVEIFIFAIFFFVILSKATNLEWYIDCCYPIVMYSRLIYLGTIGGIDCVLRHSTM